MALQEEFEKQGNWLFKYRSYLPIVVLFIGLLLFLRTELYPEFYPLKGISNTMVALFTSLFGFFIRVYTVGHTPKNSSGRNTKQGQVADALNTTGIYSIVRHPLYVGNFFMWLGIGLLTGHIWFVIFFVLFYWLYYERIMFAEEQFLRNKFGKEYLEWAKKVPAFIPKLKIFRKSDLPFSWKKVLKKEKNGLFALFLIFSAFDISGEILKGETDYNLFLVSMCILTGVGYVILKYLKTNTDLLVEVNR